MNLPPLLLGATLVFWGWQTGLPTAGGVLAIFFEGTRLTRFRWDSTEDELNRLWNLVTVIFLAAAVFAFTSNEGPLAFTEMFDNPGLSTSRIAGESSQKTAASLIQWMPMIFFLFLMAVTLSRQSTVKLRVLSLIARRQQPGRPLPPMANREIHVGWLYFAVCLVSSSINSRNDGSFFAGLSVLMIWALWTRRSRRFGLPLWGCTAVAACLLAYWGQDRLGEVRLLVDNFTPQWGWRVGGRRTNPDQDRTSIGQIGRLKGSGRIVVRVTPKDESTAPTLLRTASYRFYRSPIWAAGSLREEVELAGRFDTVVADQHAGDWTLRQGLTDNRLEISAYLEGGMDLLPLPMGVTRLEHLPVFTLKTNGLGVVVAEGPGVVIFDALSGADGSIDGPPTEADRHVSTRELAGVQTAVEQANLVTNDTARLLRSLSAFFQNNFRYSLWQDIRFQREETPTPLARFLLESRKGHCEYFATATVLMLRELGIPARYAVGWAVDEASGSGYVVRERHAHAWCIYYDFGDHQWHDFDTTPASWMQEENRRASIFESLSDFWQRIKYEFAKWRWGQSNLREYVWWIIGPMLVFLLYRLLRRKPGERAGSRAPRNDRPPVRLGLDSEFYQVEQKLGDLGYVRLPGESQAEFVERTVRDVRVGSLREVMFALLRAHYRLRFDPLGLTGQEREALGIRVRDVLQRLSQPKPSE